MPRALSSPKPHLRDCYLLPNEERPLWENSGFSRVWEATGPVVGDHRKARGGASTDCRAKWGPAWGWGPDSCSQAAASSLSACGRHYATFRDRHLGSRTCPLAPRSLEKLTNRSVPPPLVCRSPRALPAHDSLASEIPPRQAGRAPLAPTTSPACQ